jgi:biotin synthase
MGAAWRNPTDKDLEIVCKMIKKVSSLGLETCATLGMLNKKQAKKLSEAGLDYYNHNIDTSENYYEKIITTRKFEDRLNTLSNVRGAGLKVCCGGILGMGETLKDRAEMLRTLANLPKHPESVPLNQLIKIPGTPLENKSDLDPFDLIKTISVARIMMPKSYLRLSAGRTNMNDSTQALAFFAGANSIFQGDVLLTAPNPEKNKDTILFNTLGLNTEKSSVSNNA